MAHLHLHNVKWYVQPRYTFFIGRNMLYTLGDLQVGTPFMVHVTYYVTLYIIVYFTIAPVLLPCCVNIVFSGGV